jgi:hypothetical protein
MQELSSQVNRPFGWGFNGMTGGEIRYMKLWQVSVDIALLLLRVVESFRLLAHRLELQYRRFRSLRPS